jgi:predicted PurR-regulated permease PerM
MKIHPLTAKNWFIVALVALGLGIWFVSPYLGVIALAALMAFLFNGTYVKLRRKFRAGSAATLTFLFSLVIVLVPVLLVGVLTAFQLGYFVTNVTNAFGDNFSSLPEAMQGLISNINATASQIGVRGDIITAQGVVEFIKNTLPGILRTMTAFLTGFVGSIPMTIIMAIMYIFLFFEFLVYGKKITSSIVALSPFQPEVTRTYLSRVGLMANAMAKGQLVMSAIIGVLEAAVLGMFFNIWDYFFLMAVAFTIFNLIPLGAGIVIYPIILVFLALGNFWPAIGALVVITAVSNLESFLRPKFIPKSITLTNGLTMLSAFGGIALYGLLGVIYGPIIMIVIVTSIQMYLDYYETQSSDKKKAKLA